MPRGQGYFLDAAGLLQEVLLPLLSAQSLMRLGCTSKAMKDWIFSTPPQLWQVTTFRMQSLSMMLLVFTQPGPILT